MYLEIQQMQYFSKIYDSNWYPIIWKQIRQISSGKKK